MKENMYCQRKKQLREKEHYVVRLLDFYGQHIYYKALDYKDAVEFLNNHKTAYDIIYTQSRHNNYFHKNVNIIETKRSW